MRSKSMRYVSALCQCALSQDAQGRCNAGHAQLGPELCPVSIRCVNALCQCALSQCTMSMHDVDAMQATPSLALNFALYDSFKEAWLRHISPLHLDLDSGISHLFGVDGQRGAAGDARGSSCSSGGGGRSTSSAGSSQSRSPTALPAARHMTASSSLACGAAAGFCSSTLTYPLDLIRRRVQVRQHTRMVQQSLGSFQITKAHSLQSCAHASPYRKTHHNCTQL